MATLELDFEKHTNRSCGSCSLCCRLLPQKELRKGANTRCQHQRHSAKGSCSIYAKRPPSCVLWSCGWLVRADTVNLSRPDRSHVVIDIFPDVITIQQEDAEDIDMEVIVLWVDPAHKDAWKHPAMLAYLNKRAEEGQRQQKNIAVLVRYDSSEGLVAFPPATTGRDQWFINESQVNQKWTDRSTFEKLERLAAL